MEGGSILFLAMSVHPWHGVIGMVLVGWDVFRGPRFRGTSHRTARYVCQLVHAHVDGRPYLAKTPDYLTGALRGKHVFGQGRQSLAVQARGVLLSSLRLPFRSLLQPSFQAASLELPCAIVSGGRMAPASFSASVGCQHKVPR